MSDDVSGGDGGTGDTDGWDAGAEPISGSTPRIVDAVPHSRLVGLMAEPVSRSVPLRRSTVLMLVAFLGFGTLSYLYPPNGPTTASNSGTFIPVATTPTTYPATTTTTSRPGGAETTTTSTTTSTTTTRPISTTTTSTSAPVSSTTTTAPRGSTTTTTTTLGTPTITTPAP